MAQVVSVASPPVLIQSLNHGEQSLLYEILGQRMIANGKACVPDETLAQQFQHGATQRRLPVPKKDLSHCRVCDRCVVPTRQLDSRLRRPLRPVRSGVTAEACACVAGVHVLSLFPYLDTESSSMESTLNGLTIGTFARRPGSASRHCGFINEGACS